MALQRNSNLPTSRGLLLTDFFYNYQFSSCRHKSSRLPTVDGKETDRALQGIITLTIVEKNQPESKLTKSIEIK